MCIFIYIEKNTIRKRIYTCETTQRQGIVACICVSINKVNKLLILLLIYIHVYMYANASKTFIGVLRLGLMVVHCADTYNCAATIQAHRARSKTSIFVYSDHVDTHTPASFLFRIFQTL